jgi:hypothetical protein
MGIILPAIQQGLAGFKALLAYWLNTGLSITDLICCWHPKGRPAEFRRKDGARPAFFLFLLLLYVFFVFFLSLYCLCVYVYCTADTEYQPNCS